LLSTSSTIGPLMPWAAERTGAVPYRTAALNVDAPPGTTTATVRVIPTMALAVVRSSPER